MHSRSFSDLSYLWQQQLLSQAAWYNLRGRTARNRISDRLVGHFLAMQQPLGTQCFLEIGAHEATFSRRAKSRYPNVHVFAFEANPYVFAKQQYTILNDNPDINYIHLAIADHDGMAYLVISDSIAGVAESLDSKRHGLLAREDADKVHRIEVPCAKLDTFVVSNNLENLQLCLWIDAEGASSQVLMGAENILHLATSLYIEVDIKKHWDGQWEASQLFEWLLEHDFLPVFRDFEWAFQYNVVWINKKMYYRVDNHNALYIQRCIRNRVEEIGMLCHQL